MSFQLSDRLFVALAKKVGFPNYDTLRRCRDLQLEWLESGTPASLFSVAVIEGVVSPAQVASFLQWGQQVTAQHGGQATRDQIHEPRPALHETDVVTVRHSSSPLPVQEPVEELGEEDLILEPPPSEELDLLADSLPAGEPLPEKPLFAEDEDEPVFLEDEDDATDEYDYDEEVEDTGDLRLLPDDDDEDMFALRRMDSRPKPKAKADTGVMEILDERSLHMVDEDEVSEVICVTATHADLDLDPPTRAAASAVELGLEEDPLMGIFESLDAEEARQKKPKSRLGGLVTEFDDDSEPLDRERLYTEDEVLELVDSEDWRSDDVEELTTDEIVRPRRRSRRRMQVSSARYPTIDRSGSRSGSRARRASRRSARTRRF